MGVPQLFPWLAQRHPGAVRALRNASGASGASYALECDALYVDFNSIVHQSARPVVEARDVRDGADLEDAVICASLQALDHLLTRVRPCRLLYVAVDGLPPRSKLHQQRARRYMAAWRLANIGTGAKPGTSGVTWDSNAVTPGTQFMSRLSQALRAYAAQGAEYGIVVEVSTSDEAGEGEQKIFRRLRAESRAERAVVHGLDADLLLMAMSSPARRSGHLHVVRQDDDGRIHVVDAGRLAREVAARVDGAGAGGAGICGGRNVNHADASALEDARVCDFVILVSLMGNDFVPGLPGLSIRQGGLDLVMRLHAQARLQMGLSAPDQRLSSGGPEALGGIQPALLARVLDGVAAEEASLLARADAAFYARCAAASRVRVDRRDPEAYPLHAPSPAVGTVRPGEGAVWRQRYYHHVMRVGDTGGVRDVCVNYIAGLAWSLRYLSRQVCCAQGWWYAPTHAPCALDLGNALCDPGIGAAVSAELDARAELPPEAHLEPAWQLLMVLPLASVGLLPSRLRGVPLSAHCEHMYPQYFRLATYLCDRLWQCVPLLPPMDLECLREQMMTAAAAATAVATATAAAAQQTQ
jgi:5'-3' exonuclease